ncbi:uncharacterized protein [Lepeophtheirus salmonis]|uniref:uncharacterized protein isoform X2 n=1 Tax=Lepeophtheirus salmonis TaxID=72036 RepID=UPI003AF3369C
MRCYFQSPGFSIFLLSHSFIILFSTVRSKSSNEAEWKKEFRNHLVVPDVINRVPHSLLTIDYGQGPVATGATLSRASIEKVPRLEWNLEKGEQLYTVFIVNPDVPNRREPIEAEWQHMTVYNLRNTNLKSGDATVEYSANYSHRLKTGLQRIVFLVFKQQGKVDVSDVKKWNSSTHRTPDGNSRGDIHIKTFAKTQGFIKPIAGNFFYVSNKEESEFGKETDASSSRESLHDDYSCQSISDCKQSYVCIQNECKMKRKRSARYEEESSNEEDIERREGSSEDTPQNFDNRVKDHRNFLGQYKYPSICHQTILGNCSYLARWFSTDKAQVIEFLIQTRERNLTGIGFNDRKELPNSDFILANKEDNSIQDSHIQNPSDIILDEKQDLKDKSSKMKGNVWEISFSRRLGATDEKEDVDLSSPKGVFIYVPRFVRSESTLRPHDVIFSHIPYNFRFAYTKNLKRKEKEDNQTHFLPGEDKKAEVESKPSSLENEYNSSGPINDDSVVKEPRDEDIDSTTELPMNQSKDPKQSGEENADERELDYDSESYDSIPYYENAESNQIRDDEDDGSIGNKSYENSNEDSLKSKEKLDYDESLPKLNHSANKVNELEKPKEYRQGKFTSRPEDSLEENDLKIPESSNEDDLRNEDKNLSDSFQGKPINKKNFSGSKDFDDDGIDSSEDLNREDDDFSGEEGKEIKDLLEEPKNDSDDEDRSKDTELASMMDDLESIERNKTKDLDNIPTSEEIYSEDDAMSNIEPPTPNTLQEEYDSQEKNINKGNDSFVDRPIKDATHTTPMAEGEFKNMVRPTLENSPSDYEKANDVNSNVDVSNSLVTPGTGQGKSPFPIEPPKQRSDKKPEEERRRYFEHVMEDTHILKYPPSCETLNCGIIVRWKNNQKNGAISFEVSCSKKEHNSICGIGFSTAKDIRNSDYLEMDHGKSSDNHVNNKGKIYLDQEDSLFNPIKGRFDSFKFERAVTAKHPKEDVSFNKGPLWVYSFFRPNDRLQEEKIVFSKYPIDFMSIGKHLQKEEDGYSKYSEDLPSVAPKDMRGIKFPIEIKANGVYIRISPNVGKNQKQIDLIVNHDKQRGTDDYSQGKQALDKDGVTPLNQDGSFQQTTSRIKDIINPKVSKASTGTSRLIEYDESKSGIKIHRAYSLSRNKKNCFANTRTNSLDHPYVYFLECRNGVYQIQKCPQVAVFWKLLQCCVHFHRFPCQSHCLN